MPPRPDLTGYDSGQRFAAARHRYERRQRLSGAITALLIIALTALALRDFPSATPATCQPPGTLTKVTL